MASVSLEIRHGLRATGDPRKGSRGEGRGASASGAGKEGGSEHRRHPSLSAATKEAGECVDCFACCCWR